MHPAFYVLWYLQGALALVGVCLAMFWWLRDRDDIVSRYVLGSLRVDYLWAFGTALLVALAPA